MSTAGRAQGPGGKESMHPIERLRWVARSPEGDLSLAAAEAADALAAFADDPAGLVIASRRLIERRPAAGPLWWLASRVLCSLEPGFEAVAARRCVLALLEATAVGPDSFVAPAGSAVLADAARGSKRPVWLVAGVGRVLPGPLYEALVRRLGDDPGFEVVPLSAVEEVAGPGGPVPVARMPRPACPVAAELLRFSG